MRLNQFNQPVGETLQEWTTRMHPARSPLKGHFCHLEPISQTHADALWDAYMQAGDDRDWTYLPIDRPENREAFELHIKEMTKTEDPLHFAVIDLRRKKAIGSVSFLRIDPENGSLEIGYVNWSPLLQKQPCGTEAIYLLLEHAFDHLHYRRCEWKCDSLNEPSIKAALRYGFSYEGTFRQASTRKGRNRDTAWYSIIDHEWPMLRHAFQCWLNISNFDATGRQKRKLAEFMKLPPTLHTELLSS